MSSFAVLEVNAADTDAASDSSGELAMASDSQDAQAPVLLMEPNSDIAVQVDAPMKQLSTMETYVTYRVRCACARWSTPPFVRRRYNQFKALRDRLAAEHPLLPVPPLPPLHTARQQLDRYSPGFVLLRTHALHAFLDRVARHPQLTLSEHLRAFLTASPDTVDRALRSDGGALRALGGVMSLLAPPSGSVRVKEPEFTAAADYLQSLQHKLSTLASLAARQRRLSAALGREMGDMKPACEAWCERERGVLAAAVRAAGAGAAAAGAARAEREAARVEPALAQLPQLAAYAGVVRSKILERDALHNACSTAANATDDMRNRLEQFSEALRAELCDWTPKTKAEIKAQLLDMAEKQLLIQQRTLVSWERALASCRENDVQDIFKTVSRTAVINLSPSRSLQSCRDRDRGGLIDSIGGACTGRLPDSGNGVCTGELPDSGNEAGVGRLPDSSNGVETGRIVDSGNAVGRGRIPDPGDGVSTGGLPDSGDSGNSVSVGWLLDSGGGSPCDKELSVNGQPLDPLNAMSEVDLSDS